jgi:hypothetical protein
MLFIIVVNGNLTHAFFSRIREYEITKESPSPSCPVARNTFDKPGTGPITGFPSGTRQANDIIIADIQNPYLKINLCSTGF